MAEAASKGIVAPRADPGSVCLCPGARGPIRPKPYEVAVVVAAVVLEHRYLMAQYARFFAIQVIIRLSEVRHLCASATMIPEKKLVM